MTTSKKISDLRPQQSNVNKHTSYGLRLLEKSVQGDGWLDAQTAAADGEIISGSARIELAAEKFADVEPIIVHSDGSRPVIVIRDDIPNAEHPRARRLSVAANKIAQVDFDPDWALLAEWGGEDEQIKKLFSDDEWREGTGAIEEDDTYSRKVETPIYEIKGENPKITELFNDERYKKLLSEIDAANIPDEQKDFLKIAATRHVIFDFSKIAEYYAHADKILQGLMENNALIIIDFDKAIELGYVKLSEELKKQFAKEYPNE